MQAGIPRVCSIVFIKHLLTIVSLAIVSVAIALLMTITTGAVNNWGMWLHFYPAKS